ncbi:hypothetical protein CFP56_019784 [Quercus suber]|uniref:DUF8040 domain-containing protein n=1 Tax=Quercus suber TaxID=58331 RepID=A0AAW0M0A3_QUESU
MATKLITWDGNCEDMLCDFVLGHYVCGNLRPYHANAQVWGEVIDNLNACMGNAFIVRRIFSNTPPLNTDEERALEEELANANASAPTHLDNDCYTPNFESFPQIVEDVEVEEVTQWAGKRLVQDASGKGKKVSRNSDRVNEMTVALKEYTAMMKDRHNGKLGKSNSSSNQFTQSGVGGDPCSLGKVMKVLNSYADLSNNAYIKMSKYDFDNAYFNDVSSSNDCEENDDDWTDLESGCEEEAEFNLVNPIVREMYAYIQRHYDKQPMRTSPLTGKVYMDEVTEGNLAKCYQVFHMTPKLLLHLVDKLAQHGYLRDGLSEVNATQAVAMLLYILGDNTRFRCVADRFQHSTETVYRYFRKVLRAVRHYVKHLIKPNQNVTGLPEYLQVNKYWPWFESDELFRTIRESVGEGSATNSEGSGDARASTSSMTQRHVLEMSSASKRAMGQFRDNITDTMWDDYVARGNVR